MKKKIIPFIILSLTALMCFLTLGANSVLADSQIINSAYEFTAVSSGDGSGGNALLFAEYTQTAEEVEISFDMLENVKSGYFGVVFTSKMSVGDYLNKDNLILFGKNNEQIKSESIAESSDFTFERGYNYVVLYNRTDKNLTISRRAFGKKEYAVAYTTPLKLSTGVCGLAVMTKDSASARVLIDNLKITEGEKVLINEDFNSQNATGDFTLRCSENSYAKVSADFPYRITFLNENGDLLEEKYTTIHNYAECSVIPSEVPSGKRFVGWDKMITDATSDAVICVKPVFEDLSDGNTDNADSNGKGCRGGCKSSISFPVSFAAPIVLSGVCLILLGIRLKRRTK